MSSSKFGKVLWVAQQGGEEGNNALNILNSKYWSGCVQEVGKNYLTMAIPKRIGKLGMVYNRKTGKIGCTKDQSSLWFSLVQDTLEGQHVKGALTADKRMIASGVVDPGWQPMLNSMDAFLLYVSLPEVALLSAPPAPGPPPPQQTNPSTVSCAPAPPPPQQANPSPVRCAPAQPQRVHELKQPSAPPQWPPQWAPQVEKPQAAEHADVYEMLAQFTPPSIDMSCPGCLSNGNSWCTGCTHLYNKIMSFSCGQYGCRRGKVQTVISKQEVWDQLKSAAGIKQMSVPPPTPPPTTAQPEQPQRPPQSKPKKQYPSWLYTCTTAHTLEWALEEADPAAVADFAIAENTSGLALYLKAEFCDWVSKADAISAIGNVDLPRAACEIVEQHLAKQQEEVMELERLWKIQKEDFFRTRPKLMQSRDFKIEDAEAKMGEESTLDVENAKKAKRAADAQEMKAYILSKSAAAAAAYASKHPDAA